MQTEQRRPSLTGHYRNILRLGEPSAGLESPEGGREPDLSTTGINQRLDVTNATLHQIVREHLNDDPALHAVADQIIAAGGQALRYLGEGDDRPLQDDPNLAAALEVIVRSDGSRPSFMIRDGEVDRSTSPLGAWSDTLDASAEFLADAIACVGRIDVPDTTVSPQGFEGTGFLIQQDLILTNRHVLQVIAGKDDSNTWVLKPDVAIDFGHEFRGQDSIRRRALKRVLFAGAKPITANPIDHARLDLALIELEPARANHPKVTPLAVDKATDWSQPDLPVYTVGYPAVPMIGAYKPTLLEQLFKSTFGCKRLAPGLILPTEQSLAPWTTAHDSTTLGGNSGSVVLVAGREFAAAALHYGGRRREPSENWGHVLGLTLDQTDGRSATTLREILEQRGVQLVDRLTI